MGHNLETRSFLDEVRSFDNAGVLFDLGHPLLNRMAGSFVTAAGIGAVQAVSREACFTALERETNRNSVEALVCLLVRVARLCNYGYMLMKIMALLVTSTGKESLQWGLAAGMYSGLTFGLKEARGVHDWKNSAVAGAITGATLALTSDDSSQHQIVQFAITGAAMSTAANLLTGIF
ncbi:outer envelope pore protein 16-2, chloroplastic-like isoform X2 [Cynara cardunculus var. scolymus]|uniref:outer envelope pore protein 16-2, chloroplastic-like isoform X2 n=1 Tax=Cynara cardunculus var. scolymus TaxID=59895 RepID=UPI000D623CDB|nr:outer envelope pore protein 16-2, chloroplastic-like isoform X2 [Cynara cardunculus var. scolymus]